MELYFKANITERELGHDGSDPHYPLYVPQTFLEIKTYDHGNTARVKFLIPGCEIMEFFKIPMAKEFRITIEPVYDLTPPAPEVLPVGGYKDMGCASPSEFT